MPLSAKLLALLLLLLAPHLHSPSHAYLLLVLDHKLWTIRCFSSRLKAELSDALNDAHGVENGLGWDHLPNSIERNQEGLVVTSIREQWQAESLRGSSHLTAKSPVYSPHSCPPSTL